MDQQAKTAVRKDGRIGIAWTGQAGFAFKDARGLVYHIDPYLSDACSRFIGYHRIVPAPVEAGDVRADCFLFTHEHRDHLDPDSVPVMAEANPNAVLAGPPSCIRILAEMGIDRKRLIAIERGDSRTIGRCAVHAVPALHTNDSVGYVLRFGKVCVYVTGDTVYSDELVAVGGHRPDVMMICINGRLGCMNIREAVRLTSRIEPSHAVPMHYGMFAENTASPGEYVRQVEVCGGTTRGFVADIGRWYVFESGKGFLNIK